MTCRVSYTRLVARYLSTGEAADRDNHCARTREEWKATKVENLIFNVLVAIEITGVNSRVLQSSRRDRTEIGYNVLIPLYSVL